MAKTPTISADVYGTVLTINFSDGRELRLEADTLADHIRKDALMHGLKQKLMDAGAIARNTDTGASATLSDKFDAINAVFERITGPSPTWNKVSSKGDGPGANLLIRALMQLKGLPRAKVEAWLEEKTKEDKAALKKNPRVAEVILALQVADAGDTAASDDLLDELG